MLLIGARQIGRVILSRETAKDLLAILCLAVMPAFGQSPAAKLIAAGDSVNPLLHPDQSMPYYQHALALDSTSYPALWRVARADVDIAKQIDGTDGASRARRDSLYLLARGLGERAVRADSTDPDGHFVLALALGRLARTRGGRERVKFGRIIYDEAAAAIRLKPDHDGAHHILGAWHAEVERLSGTTKFFARMLFGAGFLSRASWDSATAHLNRAIEVAPNYIYHRLELAEVYLDLDRAADARVQLEAIAGLPDSDVMDPVYRRRAALLLEGIRGKSGR